LVWHPWAYAEDSLTSPVIDAKQAYHNGIKEFVGIQLADELLLLGVKTNRQAEIRKKHMIRPLNHRWRTRDNLEQNPRRLYKLKRYANRYNLTIDKLLKAEELEQQRRYRY
jgi:hypothetical protein